MSETMLHAEHVLQFDGVLHWCVLIAVVGLLAGLAWVYVRVLLPLRRLSRQAEQVMLGQLPLFAIQSHGIREVEQLCQSLCYLMQQVQAAQEQELRYRTALTGNQENERLRLAREIHDDTIQSLVVVAHHIERAAVLAPADAAAHPLEEARRQLFQTIDNLRHMIGNLRPTILEDLGLAVAIEALCEQHTMLKVAVTGMMVPLDPEQELALFRAAQEAIHNAERHAHAQVIEARLNYSDAEVTLEVRDDGAGFSIPPNFQELARRGHYGLLGIRERIVSLGGSVGLKSEGTAGTCLTVSIPMLPASS